jgi:signal peptidase
MEPALRVGGVIVTRPVATVQEGDIVTFLPAGQEIKVTHRVVDIIEKEGKRWFQTKGDANEEPDPNLISFRGDRIEKAIFHLPYAGFLASFIRSEWGFLALVGVPALFLIGMFGRNAWEGIQEEREKRRRKAINPDKGSEGQSGI